MQIIILWWLIQMNLYCHSHRTIVFSQSFVMLNAVCLFTWINVYKFKIMHGDRLLVKLSIKLSVWIYCNCIFAIIAIIGKQSGNYMNNYALLYTILILWLQNAFILSELRFLKNSYNEFQWLTQNTYTLIVCIKVKFPIVI